MHQIVQLYWLCWSRKNLFSVEYKRFKCLAALARLTVHQVNWLMLHVQALYRGKVLFRFDTVQLGSVWQVVIKIRNNMKDFNEPSFFLNTIFNEKLKT